MGLTVYLFNELLQQRAAIVGGMTELIHSEADGALTLEMQTGHRPRPGEHVGFLCRDGRYRLFEIQTVDDVDAEGLDYIEAVDSARAELETTISTGAVLADKPVRESVETLISGTGWEIGEASGTGEVGKIADTMLETLSAALTRISDTAGVRIVPYYRFSAGKITGKMLDILPGEPVWRGRIISARTADDIVLTEEGPPMGRVYAIGGYTGTGEERKQITLADAVWNTAEGDPADKPAGQAYIDQPDYVGVHRRAFVYQNLSQQDPQALAQEAWEELQSRSTPMLIGQARAGDIAFLDGWSHEQVQVNDLAGVRSRSGRSAQERVANVRRHYVFPELTVFEFGEEQRRLWVTEQIAENQQQTRRLGGGVSAVQQVVEDQGVELYRAIEQLVELDEETITEFREVWIDLDATKTEITQKASLQRVNELTGQLEEFSTTVTVGVDGLRETIRQGDNVIATLRATIDGLENWVTDADGNISELVNSVRGLESIVQAADGRISTLVNTADGLTSTIYGQGGEMAELRTRINEISMTVSEGNGTMAGLVVQSQQIAGVVRNADGRITAVAMTADGIVSQVSDQGDALSLLQQRIDEISATVESAGGDIGRLLVRSNEISATIETVGGRVSALAVTADGLVYTMSEQGDELASIRAQIDQISLQVKNTSGDVARIALSADRAVTTVTNADKNISSKFEVLAGVIDMETKSDGTVVSLRLDAMDNSLRAQAGEIELKADLILLDAYVKATTLEANYAKLTQLSSLSAQISNLTSGLTTANVLRALTVSANQTSTTYLTADSVTYNGELVSKRAITMGSISTKGKAMSTGGTLDLQHSHKVTVGEDGTITLGEVATTGGNFKVADTKIYKDAVSAAEVAGWNACREACTRITNVYTISQQAPSGGLYTLVNGQYTSVGTGWVRVTSYTSAYKRPEEKEAV